MLNKSFENLYTIGTIRDVMKNFVLLYFSSLIIVGGLFFLVTHSEYDKKISIKKKVETKQLELMKFSMVRDLEVLASDLRMLQSSEILAEYINNSSPKSLAALGQRFALFAADRKMYAQIRFINNIGLEVVRVDYSRNRPRIIPREQLQNKKDRYYFKNTINLKKGEIYYSPLDLNIEQKKLEYPFKPMFRVATPVYNNIGRTVGIIILNYRAQLMLDRFQSLQPVNSKTKYSMLNQNGFWIKSSRPENEWGFILNHKKAFSKEFPIIWEEIKSVLSGEKQSEKGFFMFNTIHPEIHLGINKESSYKATVKDGISSRQNHWHLVAYLPSSEAGYLVYLKNSSNTIFVFICMLFFLAIMSWLITKTRIEKKKTSDFLSLLSKGLEQSPASIVITDKDGNIAYVNPKFEDMSGYSHNDVLEENPRIFKSGKTSEEVYANLWETIIQGSTWVGDFENKHKSGHPYYVAAKISPILGKNGDIKHFISIQEDITEKLELQKKLEIAATVDSLTGAANRGYFMKRCDQEIKRLSRYNHPVAVLLFDLDHFKSINDEYGHQAGDQVLIEFVECVRQELRDSDTLGRIGGEEFATILPETDKNGALNLANRLCKKVREMRIKYEHHKISFTVSIGCSDRQDHDKKISDLLKRADQALYDVKKNGRNNVKYA